MKIITRHYHLITSIYYPTVLLSLSLIIFFPHIIYLTTRAYWILFCLAVLMIFLPISKGKTQELKYRWPVWLSLIIGIEICLFGIFYSACAIKMADADTPQTVHYLMINCGFFPWPLYALLAVSLYFFNYLQKQNGFLSNTLQSLLTDQDEDCIRIYSDAFTRSMIMLCFAIAIGFTAVNTGQILAHYLHTPYIFSVKINLAIIVLSFALLFFNNSLFWKRCLKTLLSLKAPKSLSLIIIFSVTALLILILIAAISFIDKNFPILIESFNYGLKINQHYYQPISLMLYMLIWAPLVSGFIAFISQGRSLRSILLATLIPALILYYGFIKLTTFSINIWPFPILGLLTLILFFIRTHYLKYLIRGVLPGTTVIKSRNPNVFLMGIMKISVLMAILIWVTGTLGVSVILFGALLPINIFLIISCLSLFITRKRV